MALEDSKKETVETEKSRKRKLKFEEITNVKKSKLAVQETIESLNKGIAETEEKRDFTLPSKANAFKNSVKDKQQTLTDLNAQKKLEEELNALLLLCGLCFSSSFYQIYDSVILKNFVCFFFDSFECFINTVLYSCICKSQT